MMSARNVLAALADGQPHAGTSIAARLGISRAAVWKQVAALRAWGLPIVAERGSGYKLSWPIELLDADLIRDALPVAATRHMGALEVAFSVDSTSTALRNRRQSVADASVLLAEYQTAGRGRRGRTWLGPPGMSLCLSMCKRFERGLAGLTGLPLAVGVMLVEALEQQGIFGVGLKWPNDLWVGGAKLGGILLEVDGEAAGPCRAVVGIGINLRATDAMRVATDRPVADLSGLTEDKLPSRNRLAAAVIAHVLQGMHLFGQQGWDAFAKRYTARDVLLGKRVRIARGETGMLGEAVGIDSHGALRVRTDQRVVLVDSIESSVVVL